MSVKRMELWLPRGGIIGLITYLSSYFAGEDTGLLGVHDGRIRTGMTARFTV